MSFLYNLQIYKFVMSFYNKSHSLSGGTRTDNREAILSHQEVDIIVFNYKHTHWQKYFTLSCINLSFLDVQLIENNGGIKQKMEMIFNYI